MTTLESNTKTNTRHDRVATIRTFIIKNAKQSVNTEDLTSIGRLSDKAMELLIEAFENGKLRKS